MKLSNSEIEIFERFLQKKVTWMKFSKKTFLYFYKKNLNNNYVEWTDIDYKNNAHHIGI